jgi:integrase
MPNKKSKQVSKGKGHLFSRGRGKTKNYYVQYFLNGKEYRKALRDDNGNAITSKPLAQKAADKLLAPYIAKDEVQRREQAAHALKTAQEKVKGLEQEQNILKMENVWQAYLDAPQDDKPNSGPGTMSNYKRHWKQFVDWLGKHHPEIKYFNDDITESIAKKYATYLRNLKIADSTFNYKHTTVKLVTRVMMKYHHLQKNVWESVKRVNNPKQNTKDNFTFEQGVATLKIFDDDFYMMHKEQIKTIFNLGVYSGMRLSDCVLLKWKNIISLADGLVIKCIPIKTKRLNKEIVAPIVTPLQDELKIAKSWKDKSGYICPDVAERFIRNPSGVKKDIIKVFIYAGHAVSKNDSNKERKVSAIGFHSLRHALFSYLASKGVTIEKLASWSGDSQKTLLQYYLHADNNKLIAEAQEIISSTATNITVEPTPLPAPEPERQQLIELAQKMPINIVKHLLQQLQNKNPS